MHWSSREKIVVRSRRGNTWVGVDLAGCLRPSWRDRVADDTILRDHDGVADNEGNLVEGS